MAFYSESGQSFLVKVTPLLRMQRRSIDHVEVSRRDPTFVQRLIKKFIEEETHLQIPEIKRRRAMRKSIYL